MKYFLIAFTLVFSLSAQTLAPTTQTVSVTAGKTLTLTITFSAGSAPVSAVQWTLDYPVGISVAWALGSEDGTASKGLTCNSTSTTSTCVVVGLNTTVLASGVVATGVLTFAATMRGTETLTLASTLGANAAGSAVATTGGTVTATALSPFDLNGNGLSTLALQQADLVTAISQVDGSAPCTTANFSADGCTVDDLMLLVIDLLSATP